MFYKETDFQESIIGNIPKEWAAKATEDLFIVETGATPSTKQETYWKDGTVNWITPTDLSMLNGKLRIKGSERKITEKALKETSLKLLAKGSIILSTRAPVGYVATLEEEATFNQGCKGLIPRSTTDILSEFYSYYLSSKKKVLQNLSAGSTFLELSKNSLEKFSMPHLPMSEQRAIVRFLGFFDSAIELADKLIAKTERLKKGLVQQLLTKGLGHREFKGTQLGKIPKEWELVNLGDAAFISKLAGFEYTKYLKYDKNGEIIALRAINIQNHKLDLSEIRRITKQLSDSLPRSKVYKDDIVFTYIGVNIGQATVIPENNKFHLGANVAKISITRKERLSPLFLMFMIESKIIEKQIIEMRSTTAQPSLNMSKIRDFKIPLPSLGEQQKIAEVLSIIDRKLWVERIEKSKLEHIKQGLMDLLLTGKVRIKVD